MIFYNLLQIAYLMSQADQDSQRINNKEDHPSVSESAIILTRSQNGDKNNGKYLVLGACIIAVLIIINILQYSLNNTQKAELLSENSQLITQVSQKNTLIKELQKDSQQLKQKVESLQQQLTKANTKRRQREGLVGIAQGTVSEVNLLMKDKSGKRIEDVLYNEEQRKMRVQFNKDRMKVIDSNKNVQSLVLSKYTLKTEEREEQGKIEAEQYQRIRKIHQLDAYTSQIPMCIIVPGFNNKANFRLQYNLNSIFLQNYTNYLAIIINDASTDGSNELFPKYLQFYNISQDKYVYIYNKQRKTALENIYIAIMEYCSEDSIVVNLDGDDQFIGKNVLKIFNAQYQKTQMGVIYSNYVRFHKDKRIEGGWTKQYPQKVKNQRSFRVSPQFFSHLKSHRASLFREIPLKLLQNDNGDFFKITSDMAIYYPLMELACGKVLKIEGYHYLYNFNTGLNDYTLNHKEQLQVEERVRKGEKLECATQAMKKWK